MLANRAKLDAALASMTDAIFISDAQGRFIEFNDAFATFHKFRNKTECAKTLAEHPAFLEVFMANGELVPLDQWAVPRALRGETATDVEFTLRRKDTGETWVRSYNFAPIRDQRGELVGSVVLGRDVTERKGEEEALRQSEERFRTMANSIPQLAWIAQADGYIFWYNQRWYEYTGATPEQMEGWGWQSAHDPLVLPKVLERWRASIATGQPLDMEFPLRGADGSFRTFLTRVLPFKDAEGHVVQWFGTNTDIDEQKRAEEEIRRAEAVLREREEQLRLYAEHSPAAIAMFDREMKYLVVSLRWMETYRLGNQSIIGRSHYEVFPEISQRWIEIHRRCLAGAVEKCDEDSFLRDDGRTDWIRWEARPWRQADGSIGGMIIFSEDITETKCAVEEIRRLNAELERRVIERTAQLQATNIELHTEMEERKRTEVVLHRSEELFRMLVDGVQDYAICMLSPQGHVVSWNKGAERIKGYETNEIMGKHFSCFYTPKGIAEGKPEWEIRTAIEQGRMEVEGWRVRKNGQQYWANVVITAVFDKDGCLQGFAKITRDMTETKRIEQALQEKNIALQNAAKAKDLFLANMSHELRTPLNSIIGFTELLADGKPGGVNPKQKEYLEDVLNSGKHLLQLISDILDLAKVGSGKMELYLERFSLRKAIEEACALAKPIAQKKRIHIDVNVAPEIGDVTLDQQKCSPTRSNSTTMAARWESAPNRTTQKASS